MKKGLLVTTTLLVSMTLMAGNVTEQEALRKAQQFMQGRSFQQKNLRRAATANTFAQDAFYVFNADGNQGFVIVSADDRTPAVLGYSDRGRLDMNRMPRNMQNWLEGYARQIQSLRSGEGTAAAPQVLGKPIDVMLTCRWGQGNPYNLDCPLDGKVRSLTGCGATALAQYLYYHKPKAAKAMPAYTTETKKIAVEALPAYTFKWDVMKDVYPENATSEDASAMEVAKLMRYAGQSASMDYTSEQSAGLPESEALIKYFGFSKNTRTAYRYNYHYYDWDQLIYDELAANRPVLYYGSAAGGAHEFVIDGYDANGLFHVNWGWSGTNDGYFALSVLNPYDVNATGVASDSGFNSNQSAIIGGEPAKEGESLVLQGVVEYINTEGMEEGHKFSRTSATEDFKDVPLNFYVSSLGETASVDYAIAVYRGSEKVKQIDFLKNQTLAHNFVTAKGNISFGAGLPDGYYDLRLLVSKAGENKWMPLDIYEDASSELVKSTYMAEIKGNTLTLGIGAVKFDAKNVQVQKVEFTAPLLKDRPAAATITWLNGNIYNETTFYLRIGDDAKAASTVSSYCSYGETVQAQLIFTPKQAGANQKLRIYLDGEMTQQVYEGTISVGEAQIQKLGAEITIEGKSDNPIDPYKYTYLKGTAKVTNTGTNTYNDYVAIRLTQLDASSNPVGRPILYPSIVNIAPKASVALPIDVVGLTPGADYQLEVVYWSLEQGIEDLDGTGDHTAGKEVFFVDKNATAITTIHQSPLTDQPAYNLRGERVNGSYRGIVIRNGKKYVVK